MDIEALTEFFKWCTIINVGLFFFTAVLIMALPDFVYKVQSKFFPITKEYFDKVIYAFLGTMKLFVIFFNITPYVALLFMGS